MNKITALFSIALVVISMMAKAAEDETNSLFDRGWSGGRRAERGKIEDPNAPLYYRPTQRYYGSGYTISYRYIPVYRYDSSYLGPASGSTNFRSEAFRLATDDIPAWGTNPPRLTVKDPKSAAPRSAVTSIVRKKNTGKTTAKASSEPTPAEMPAIVPAPAEAPAPAAGAATPVPAPTGAAAAKP
jgi:hypothetical protein